MQKWINAKNPGGIFKGTLGIIPDEAPRQIPEGIPEVIHTGTLEKNLGKTCEGIL